MEIHLPEDLQRFIPDQVRTGHFPSENHVVSEALRQFQKMQASAGGQLKPDPWLGSMREDAEVLDEIVEEAMKIREERPSWRLSAVSKKQSPRRLQTFLTNVASKEVLAFDQAAAELAGQIQGELERAGQPIGRADPIIAATALQNGLKLVTGNTAHCQRIQQIGHPLVLYQPADLNPWRAALDPFTV